MQDLNCQKMHKRYTESKHSANVSKAVEIYT